MPEISLAQKSILATVILAVAFLQLVFIVTARAWLFDPPARLRRNAARAHRIGGYSGLVLLLVISYYCVFVYGSSGTARSVIHAFLGVAAVVLVLSKAAVARVFRGYIRRLPLLGGTLFGMIAGAWSTSALWYFINF